jgi:membrane protease YdiL (CAAX protease family)
MWLSRGREFELLLPFTSVVSGVLVASVVVCAGPYGSLGFARAAPRHFGEALLAATVGLAAAAGWLAVLHGVPDGVETDAVQRLTDRLGVPVALFVVAATPAVLEEVMFRGMLQGRLLALCGVRIGLLLTAVAFALCHAQPNFLPIHLGLGLYLGWLRERAGSLLPGMLAHFAYNGAIVVLGLG